MSKDNRVIRVLTIASLTACMTGCVRLFSDNSQQWWFASITSVVRPSEIPSQVDRYCLGVPGKVGEMENGAVAIVSIQLGRRMPRYKQAIPLENGQIFHPGDNVLVQPRFCKVKLDGP
ncbi:hypothetical protein [Rhodanobacter denitrificans]|uniref:hypothetical protein n=1 Tax=Rhodanobacter denitrificans TaxID=666685 RepID=UPI001F325D0B|nr:hypothetical protein [Rhodanobacter denitrificans]UJJ58314.1 hypothetical protein LRK55_16980 [Rhodanobacter denitrificans]